MSGREAAGRDVPLADAPAGAVCLAGVDLTLDGRQILSSVNFLVDEGQHWVVLGPNGSGKTTILQIIAGYQWPTRGRVSVLGRELGAVDVRELRREIGIVSTGLTRRIPEGDTCLQVVISGRFASLGLFYQRPTPQDASRAGELLARVGCEQLADRPFGALSAGERQRVMLARALMPSPRLLLLDEPTARLDIGGRESFFRSLRELMEPSTVSAGDGGSPTVLFVTHHIEEVIPVFTHALLLRQGRVVAAGPIAEALTSRTVSEAYDLSIQVVRRNGRFWALPVTAAEGRP